MAESEKRSVTILGAGAFGTAMAHILGHSGADVTLWDYKPEKLVALEKHKVNASYLPRILLPDAIQYEVELTKAVGKNKIAVLALPSRSISSVLKQISNYDGVLVSLTKGLDIETGDTISTQIHKCCPNSSPVALGGPTFADEIGRFVPSAMVAGAESEESAKMTQHLFSTPSLRVYTSSDIKGVEIGGALKNIFAIAAGVSDGLGFGDNSKAALATRALLEIQKLGVIMGGRSETFLGLSGLGDLMATCFSHHSRNRRFGHFLGEGVPVNDIPTKVGVLVEGVPCCQAAYHLAQKHGVETPIINEIYQVLYHSKSPRQAIADLINRRLKAENS